MTTTTNRPRRSNCMFCQPDGPATTICDRHARMQNEHEDGHHADKVHKGCPDCEAPAPTNTAPHSHSSHADCYAKGAHDATKAGRAACRRGRQA